jgi:hypothetical protein
VLPCKACYCVELYDMPLCLMLRRRQHMLYHKATKLLD